jgi:signal transduction histidine kinase/ActR/RegA family two-component response regulator
MLEQAKVSALEGGLFLRGSELQFQNLLEKLPAGAYTCDPEGLITYFNQHAVQLWGRSPKLNDPVDRFCGSFKLFSTDGAPIAHNQCWMALALQTDAEYNGHEIIIERPDGQRLTALAHANPIRDHRGKLLGAVNVLVDISDRKRAEDALREADRSKNEFLATLAHELRNPLAPIRNAVQILQMTATESRAIQQVVNVIDRQSRQMTRLIDDLLDIARITSNKLELRNERIEVAEVINSAVETSRPLIQQRGHELVITPAPEPIHINGDLVRLAQVISNLLNNAAKYTERGGRIWLTAERSEGEVKVTVRDTGIGIRPEMLPEIFEMFTRSDRATAASPSGLGIGLTLARRLVEMHGGVITAGSQGLGKGSEFSVRLPAFDRQAPTERTDSSVNHGSKSEKLRSLRVLVVDDNRDSADSMGLLLGMMGNVVKTVHDGPEALAITKEFQPDVVLLDIGLPTLDGYDVARKIRQEPWGKEVVLIAVTGWGLEADIKRSKESGFNHHMVKPADPEALTQLLASLAETRAEVPGNAGVTLV